MSFLSLAHEDTSEVIFFSCLWNAPDCTKRDVQLYSKNASLSWAEPPSIPAHMNTYHSHYHVNQSKGEWKVLFYGYWLVQALGLSYTCYLLRFPLSSFTYPTTKSVTVSLSSEGSQSHCRFLSYGSLPIANIDQKAVWQRWRQFMLISKRSKNVVERIPSWIWQHPEIICHSTGKWGCD